MNPDLLLAHYHEIGLKGRNRPRFERALRDNLKRALGDSAGRVRLVSGRVEITEPKPDALERVTRVFGVANVAPVLVARADLDAIVATAVDVARDADTLTPFETFEVRARRARTPFAATSQVVNETVGDAIRLGLAKRVDLSHPDVSVRIEIVHDKAYVSAAKVPGPGGLPVGTAGPVVTLLSAGIDSPVATWRMMRRGADPIAVHFHGQPFTDRSSEQKVAQLIDVLGRWGYRRPWWSVPMGEAQREITLSAPSSLRVLLYRRLMLRVAEGHRPPATAPWPWSPARASARSPPRRWRTWPPSAPSPPCRCSGPWSAPTRWRSSTKPAAVGTLRHLGRSPPGLLHPLRAPRSRHPCQRRRTRRGRSGVRPPGARGRLPGPGGATFVA